MSRIVWAQAALAVLLHLAAAPMAQARVSTALSQKAPDAASLTATVDANGFVPIIVEFASPFAPEELKAKEGLARAKAEVAAMQDAIIAAHFGDPARPAPGQGFERSLRRFELSPMFAINVSKVELEALANDPRVLRIHENKLSRP